jgi:quinol monooxygenase YgiN
MRPLIIAMTALLGLGAPIVNAQEVTAHSVVYVEIEATEAAQAATQAALDAYEAAQKAQAGFISLEGFEQVGRAGHLVLIETWRDQAAMDAQDPAAQQQLAAALEPLRTSNVDRRPYKAVLTAQEDVPSEATVYVISHVDAAPGGDMPAMLHAWVDGSRAESGNLRFDLLQHQVRGNHYTVIEAWENSAALELHAKAPHTRAFRDAFGPLAGSPLDERIFTKLESH